MLDLSITCHFNLILNNPQGKLESTGEVTRSPESETDGLTIHVEGEQFILAARGGSVCMSPVMRGWFLSAGLQVPRGERDKGHTGEGKRKNLPWEPLQHECTEAIKNITRDECNSVYLATEKEPATPCCVAILVAGIVWTLQELKSKQKNGERWKTAEKQTEVFISCCCCCWCVKEAHHICAATTFSAIRNNGVLKWTGGLVHCLELWMLGKDLGCGKEERGLWISANQRKACGEISASLYVFSLSPSLPSFSLFNFLSHSLLSLSWAPLLSLILWVLH